MNIKDQVLRFDLSTGATVVARVVRQQPGPQRQCLLIHGNPGSMADWEEVVPLLSSDAAVAAVDLPGFGLSPARERKRAHLTLSALARDVLAVSDALVWEKPIVIGHSHGAGIALALAAAAPRRVAALVLVSSLGSPAHSSYRLLATPGMMFAMRLVAATLRVGFLRPISRSAIHRSAADACFPEPAPPDLQRRMFDTFRASPQTLVSMVQMARGNPSQQVLEAAARVTCPVSFIHGQLDALVPLRHARNVHRRILDAGGASRFRTLETAGHMLPLFQPEVVAEAVHAAFNLNGSPGQAESDSPAQ